MVWTLDNLSDLRDSRFGRPRPRHGLLLLWWFAHECVRDVDANGRVIAQCNPTNGAFGFHEFRNWENLLKESNLPYYELGNLAKTHSLPPYVTKNYTGRLDDSNTDRIIVSFDLCLNRFVRIYVTKHLDGNTKKFDQNHTYPISSDLMKEIKALSREEFLRKPTHTKPSTPPASASVSKDTANEGRVQKGPSRSSQPVQNDKCCCVLM